jgi:hypothetical protein
MSNTINFEHFFVTYNPTDYETKFFTSQYNKLNSDEQKLYNECIKYYYEHVIYRKPSDYELTFIEEKLPLCYIISIIEDELCNAY